MSLSEKCDANKKKNVTDKMDFLIENAQTLIGITTGAAQSVIDQGGQAAKDALQGVGNQVQAVQNAITEADRCKVITGVLRFVDGIAVAIILVTILQTLRSKHRLIPAVASDAFNKLGNLIGVPKHSADVMRHLKQLGMLFVVVLVLRMIAAKMLNDCREKLLQETVVLQKMVAASEDLKGRVVSIFQAIKAKAAAGAGK